MLAAGHSLGGRYRLTRVLGEGGMGVVWAAVNEAFGREVAIKVLLPDIARSDQTALDRFFNEARICGSLRHPGIVDVLDVGSAEDGSPFLVMELLDGESLDAVLDRVDRLRPADILPIVRDVARALSLAHERGVIHRDLKPANLFLHRLPTGQTIVKVLDFGISKVKGSLGKHVKTRTGTVVGSPLFMSPEQAYANVDLDGRSDVHALGTILYLALGGQFPFEGESANAIMVKIATKDPPPLGPIAPRLPKVVLDLVHDATMRERDQRIPSVVALAERIEAALASMGVSPSLPVPSIESLREPPSVSGPITGPAPRAAEITRTQDDAVPLGVARTQDVSQVRSKRSVPWPAIAAGAALIAAASAFFAWRALQPTAGPTQADPATGAVTAPAPTIAPAPAGSAAGTSAAAATSEAAPTSAPAANATLSPAAALSATAAPKVAPASPSTAAPRPPAAPAPKKGGVWGYD